MIVMTWEIFYGGREVKSSYGRDKVESVVAYSLDAVARCALT